MELFDRDTGVRRGVGDVADETLELEHTGKPVLRPQVRRKLAAVGSDEDELHLVSDHRVDAGLGDSVGNPAQGATAAIGIR